jgi:hypothetical protein
MQQWMLLYRVPKAGLVLVTAKIAPGVFRSADGLKRFRMTESDLLDSAWGPNTNFESIGSGEGYSRETLT